MNNLKEKIEILLDEIEDYIYENKIKVDETWQIYDEYYDFDKKYFNYLKTYTEEKIDEDFLNYEESDSEEDKHLKRMTAIENSRDIDFLSDDMKLDYLECLQTVLSCLEDEVNERMNDN